ncbi:MAG: NAD(P)H-dependent oxidoreductase [Bradyrhizobium sp.]|nr:MAG: NAD(P)H-dependent oxidoreductase [Bradyrhizobium sp.]
MATRFLAISGSLRAASTNSAALEALALSAPAGVEVILYRDLAQLPAFNPDEDDEGRAPPAVAALRAIVRDCDGVIIAAPEYAHGVPGALKNALDWLVASDCFPGKPVALINAAPRAFHAQTALRETLATMAGRLVPEAFVTLPLTGQIVDAQAILGDPRLARALREALDALIAAIPAQAAPVALAPL